MHEPGSPSPGEGAGGRRMSAPASHDADEVRDAPPEVADSQGMSYLVSLPRRVATVYVPLALFLVVLLFPFYWMVVTAVKPNEELLSREGNPFWVQHPTLAHVKILILTSDASKETVLAAIRGGANDYLIKTSFSKEEFLQKLNKLLPMPLAGCKTQAEQEPLGSPTDETPQAPAGPGTDGDAESTPEAIAADTTGAALEDEAQLQELIDAWE